MPSNLEQNGIEHTLYRSAAAAQFMGNSVARARLWPFRLGPALFSCRKKQSHPEQAYRQIADPTFETYGPKTGTEFEALLAERGGLPA